MIKKICGKFVFDIWYPSLLSSGVSRVCSFTFSSDNADKNLTTRRIQFHTFSGIQDDLRIIPISGYPSV